MKTIMVLLLLLLGIVPAHGAPGCDPPDCPDVVDALDGPVHESTGLYAAVLKSRNGAVKQNVEVSYKFVDGTAKQGEDYRAEQSGTVTIKAGQDHAEVPYTVLRVGADKKQFTLQITRVKPGQIGKSVAVFTIGGKR
ncbi:Calx-beta domain-containing protein [Lentzea sp. NPDC005914]|uniref:Calx-beta domain-containing protein n=1 Tax=Lentzea sp. NPDC005914 TaxID=3154572 RepID=UPI003402904F